ncbi:D-alanyl-D-alanine carboxypeptidase family protein [Inediibacterium massiliense]|uniref:D-alanyl-D-alanine carboxypeptidase family protein n=1 Tax=Inediibacterium massiliense TaxID=1658111 RepID=UPI001FA72F6A|nr:D-alanyl-D-alanine carboxypeptidase family protein [Inediibacterium massiliense]
MIFQFTTLTFAKEMFPNSASSAIVMDVKSGRVLYQKNIYAKKPMASTTKIMTALLGIEKVKLDQKVKISKKAVGVEGSSIYLGYDERVKMKDLLYGLMLRSGNDAATAIAIEVAGSVEKFAELMNQKAKEIGAKNTNFVNPHGLHDENHYTTAYDLALISREALRNKHFKEIVKTKLWIADREGYKHFYNKNKTLSQYKGGDGVKTGYTRAAGRCLVTSATRGGMQLVCVVLNDYNWFEDSYSLLDEAFDHYEPFRMIKKDGVVKTISIENGKKKNTKIVGKEEVILPLTKEEQNQTMMILKVNEKVKAPIKRGQKIGKAKIYLKHQLIYTTDLVCREDIECKTIKDKIIDYFSNSNQF